MKTKRTFIPVFTLSVALLLTACNGKEAADTKKTQTTQTTQTESGTEAVTGSVAESGTETAGLPAQSWTIYISRKTRFLQIMRMYGIRCLA